MQTHNMRLSTNLRMYRHGKDEGVKILVAVTKRFLPDVQDDSWINVARLVPAQMSRQQRSYLQKKGGCWDDLHNSNE